MSDERREPEGPEGEAMDACTVPFHGGMLRLKPGDIIGIGGFDTALHKVRRCPGGDTWGLVEFPSGGLLWTELLPRPVPDLTPAQAAEVLLIRAKIPRDLWVMGDMSRKMGQRTGGGTIVFMASMGGPFTAGVVVAKDDGSLWVSDDVRAMVDGRDDLDGRGQQTAER